MYYLVEFILQFLENHCLAVLHVPFDGVLSANLDKKLHITHTKFEIASNKSRS